MKTWFRALAIAALCLGVHAASGEAVREAELAPPAPAVSTVEAAPEAAVVLDPAADAQPLGFIPWGPGGGDDQLGTCTIYCNGEPRPYQMTHAECCSGGHICPDGSFPSGGATYWSPNYGWPVICEN